MPLELTTDRKSYRFYSKIEQFEVVVIVEYDEEFKFWNSHVTLSSFGSDTDEEAIARLLASARQFIKLFDEGLKVTPDASSSTK